MTETKAVCYHPDLEINADGITNAVEGERADLAAGCAPRRWRCICGTEHSRGHFGTVGAHRYLTCEAVASVLLGGEPQ